MVDAEPVDAEGEPALDHALQVVGMIGGVTAVPENDAVQVRAFLLEHLEDGRAVLAGGVRMDGDRRAGLCVRLRDGPEHALTPWVRPFSSTAHLSIPALTPVRRSPR